MTDDFKRKLQDYKNGTLTEEERTTLEQQLEQMEIYQRYLDEMLGDEEINRSADSFKMTEKEINLHKREASLLRKGKWRARIGTALILICLYFGVTLLTSIGTALYYSPGDPNRIEIYKDVVESAIAVTNPNVSVHLSSNSGAYFNMNVTSKITKRVGDENLEVGDFSGTFLFNWIRIYDFNWSDGQVGRTNGLFQFPGSPPLDNDQEWRRLEKLPEGTVAEAYVSYTQLFKTDEFLQQFQDKQLEPLWFAVDNGDNRDVDDYSGVVLNSFGFPSYPIWHPDDGKVTKLETSKRLWGTAVTSSMTEYPSIDEYGSGQLRDENFIKTLRILEEHKFITDRLIYDVDITKSLAYVEKNGVNIYGAVVTGPTKEILKLKDDPAVSSIRIGKVTLWNWNHES